MICGFIHDVVSSMRIHEVEREEGLNLIDMQQEIQLIPPVRVFQLGLSTTKKHGKGQTPALRAISDLLDYSKYGCQI